MALASTSGKLRVVNAHLFETPPSTFSYSWSAWRSVLSRIHSYSDSLNKQINVDIVLVATRNQLGRVRDGRGGAAYGVDYPVFWINVFPPHSVTQHIAFRAQSRQQVDAFYEAALLVGGVDNGPPGLRSGSYPPGYYAAFALDPDGNNIEVVFRAE